MPTGRELTIESLIINIKTLKLIVLADLSYCPEKPLDMEKIYRNIYSSIIHLLV